MEANKNCCQPILLFSGYCDWFLVPNHANFLNCVNTWENLKQNMLKTSKVSMKLKEFFAEMNGQWPAWKKGWKQLQKCKTILFNGKNLNKANNSQNKQIKDFFIGIKSNKKKSVPKLSYFVAGKLLKRICGKRKLLLFLKR